jgi:hypothetical protein
MKIQPMEPTKEPPKPTDRDSNFTASSVRDAAGISYRQINDWDSKGALPFRREGEAGWRKFSSKEVFTIMICAEIRRQFGVPLDRLGFVRTFMMQEKADHFRAALRLIALGFSVWLKTDLRESFVMDSDIEFGNLFDLGYFRVDEPQAFVFISVNPIVNRMLGALKDPLKLEIDPEIYAQIRAARMVPQVRDEKELEVLRLLRDGAYKRVVVKLEDGKVIEALGEIEHGGPGRAIGNDEIQRLIKSRRYQTITMTLHDGRAVRVKQSIPKVIRGDKDRSTSSKRSPARKR